MFLPKISIITVTYNAEKYIERTILSVVSQTYSNIEYIIVDGASKDKTLDVIAKYNAHSVLVSEPDNGLYDAMNKGLERATGDYVWFINAGDIINSSETLEVIIQNGNGADFLYGNTVVIDEFGNIKPYHKIKPDESVMNYKKFINGMVVCHQSMLVKRMLAARYDFSRFKIACDIEWCIKSAKNCHSFKDINIVISKFLDGGVSQQNRLKAVKERFWICIKHFGWASTILQQIKIGLNYFLKFKT
jgi:glycosyltransferase involved in cell wall biosynthesis